MMNTKHKTMMYTLIAIYYMIMLLSCNKDSPTLDKQQQVILNIDTLYMFYPPKGGYGYSIIEMRIDNPQKVIRYPHECTFRVYIDSVEYIGMAALDSTHIRLRVGHIDLPTESSEPPSLYEDYLRKHIFVVIKDTCCSRTKYYLALPK